MRIWLWLLAAAAAIGCFVMVDRLVASNLYEAHALAEAVDIESTDTYLAKLELIRRHPGPVVAVIGDSQVVGETMAEHGDRSWRSHTIDRQLQQRLSADPALKSALVVNLGANGMLPADMEFVARDALKAGADAIITNVSIRSFSADFDKAEAAMARPWLARLCRDAQDALPRSCDEASWSKRTRDLLASHWVLYRNLDFLQERYLGGSYREALHTLTRFLPRYLADPDAASPPGDELVLLFRARARFESVAFSDQHLQAQALKRTLDFVRGAGAHAIVFYSTENPTQIGQLMAPAKAEENRQKILSFLQGYASEKLVMVPPLPELSARFFLDFMHLDADGYRILAQHLSQPLARLLAASANPR